MKPINLKNETARLKILSEFNILDSGSEEAYDRITILAAKICATPFAAISFIDRNREWLKSKFGINFNEIPRGIALSAYTILNSDPLIIDDTTADKRFSSSPLVTNEPKVRFYGGVPIVEKAGFALGTLYVMDRQPRTLDRFQLETLCSLGLQVTDLLELRRRLTSLEQYTSECQQYGRQLEETNAKLELLTITDELTGLGNRRGLEEHLQHEVNRSSRYRRPLSLLLVDIDRFKKYNDTFGHPAGDELLKIVAFLANQKTRASDLVARHGGDEFAVILPNTGKEAAKKLAERIRKAVEEVSSLHCSVTISIGICSLNSRNITMSKLVAEADQALYQAKKAGRNRVFYAKDL